MSFSFSRTATIAFKLSMFFFDTALSPDHEEDSLVTSPLSVRYTLHLQARDLSGLNLSSSSVISTLYE